MAFGGKSVVLIMKSFLLLCLIHLLSLSLLLSSV